MNPGRRPRKAEGGSAETITGMDAPRIAHTQYGSAMVHQQ